MDVRDCKVNHAAAQHLPTMICYIGTIFPVSCQSTIGMNSIQIFAFQFHALVQPAAWNIHRHSIVSLHQFGLTEVTASVQEKIQGAGCFFHFCSTKNATITLLY